MAIEWTEDLSVGVAVIDNQHKELFTKVNQLLDACNQGKGKESIGEIIKFLGEYVVEHFSYEEEYMKKFNYPQFANHKENHAQFIKDFLELKNKFETDGAQSYIVIMVNRVVVNWLISHIRNVDKSLGAFLKVKL